LFIRQLGLLATGEQSIDVRLRDVEASEAVVSIWIGGSASSHGCPDSRLDEL
jgi:hypothetical protein